MLSLNLQLLKETRLRATRAWGEKAEQTRGVGDSRAPWRRPSASALREDVKDRRQQDGSAPWTQRPSGAKRASRVTPRHQHQRSFDCTGHKQHQRWQWSWRGIFWFFPSIPLPWHPDPWRGPSGSPSYTERQRELPRRAKTKTSVCSARCSSWALRSICESIKQNDMSASHAPLRDAPLDSPWRAVAQTSRGTSSGLLHRLWWRWLGWGLGCSHPFPLPAGSAGRLE